MMMINPTAVPFRALAITGIPESEGNEGSDVLCPGTRVLEQKREKQGRGWIYG